MNRRGFLSLLATSATVGVAGCSGGSGGGVGGADVIVSGSTGYEETWTVDLTEGDTLELEVTLESGIYALGNIQRNDNANNIATLETEEHTTVTEQFTVPETLDYFIVLQVTEGSDGNGEASLTLRHTNE